MEPYQNQVSSLITNLDEKERKSLHIDVLLRLLEKIEPELNDTLKEQVEDVIAKLKTVIQENENTKEYKKAYRLLTKTVRSELGYTPKGQLKDESLAMGIALGVAFGGAFLSFGVAFIGVGLPIGLAIGIAIGQSKEQQAEKDGKIY